MRVSMCTVREGEIRPCALLRLALEIGGDLALATLADDGLAWRVLARRGVILRACPYCHADVATLPGLVGTPVPEPLPAEVRARDLADACDLLDRLVAELRYPDRDRTEPRCHVCTEVDVDFADLTTCAHDCPVRAAEAFSDRVRTALAAGRRTPC